MHAVCLSRRALVYAQHAHDPQQHPQGSLSLSLPCSHVRESMDSAIMHAASAAATASNYRGSPAESTLHPLLTRGGRHIK